MLASAVLLIWARRELWFSPDEISWLKTAAAYPVKEQFHPFYGHLIAADQFAFKATLELFGPEYRAFGFLHLIGLILCAGLAFEFARRRIGALLALVPAAILLFFGSSSEILLQPLTGAQWLYSLGLGLAALFALEREDRVGDIAATLLLCLAVAWFTAGLAFVAAATVALAMGPGRPRRFLIVATPAALYAAWRLWAFQFDQPSAVPRGGIEDIPVTPEHVLLAPLYAADAVACTVAAIFGQPDLVGRGPLTSMFVYGFDFERAAKAALVLSIEALCFLAVLRGLRGRVPAKSLWVALTLAGTLWLIQSVGLSIFRMPGDNRYLYASVFVLIIVAVECARGLRLSMRGLILVWGLTGVAIAFNLLEMRENRARLLPTYAAVQAHYAAIQIVGEKASSGFDPGASPGQVFNLPEEVGSWLTLVDRYGEAAWNAGELRGESEFAREQVDYALADLLGLRLLRRPPASGSGCRLHQGAAGLRFPLPSGGVALRTSQTSVVRLRRFGDRYAVVVGEARKGVVYALAVPVDRSRLSWHLQLSAPRALLCGL